MSHICVMHHTFHYAYVWCITHYITHMYKSWVRKQMTRDCESCHTCRWVMSHASMSHVARVHESCHACRRVMSQMSMSHVEHCDMLMSHVAHIDESCRTYRWVMSHMLMSHVARIHESCHIFASEICAANSVDRWIDTTSFTCVYWHMHVCDVTRSSVWHWVMSRVRMSHVTRMDESCQSYNWVITSICMSHVTHTNEPCHKYEYGRSHIGMSHGTYMHESRHSYEWIMSDIWMRHVTHMNVSCHTYEWVLHMNTTWLMSYSYVYTYE